MPREIVTSENRDDYIAKKMAEKSGKKTEENWFHGSLGELQGELRKGKGTLGEGFYLTTDKEKASFYPKIHAKIKKLNNPDIKVSKMKHSAKNTFELHDLPASPVDVNKLKEAGYDSVRYKHELNIFDPENVKIHKG
jgi:hypothetical protein